jgi:hypothetical protein
MLHNLLPTLPAILMLGHLAIRRHPLSCLVSFRDRDALLRIRFATFRIKLA